MPTLRWIRDELRQHRYHPRFRISAPVWNGRQQAALEQLIAGVASVAPVLDEVAGLDEQALADAATNLWSAQRSLDLADGRPSREARQAGRYLRNTRDTLARAGLVIQDHDGEAFHPGLSLEVLVYSDEPGCAAETVIETVRPSIYLRDRRIQLGQVIVGRPVGPNNTVEDQRA